ncbi:hypothetical protein S83_040038 [Arachis hypogaea]|nr:uncharacterized protein DS421_12g381190 [Arachis hypogaea]
MVCAILIGFADEHHNCRCPLFFVSVFHLSIIENAIDMNYINSSASQKVQNFLTVNLKNRHVYSIVDYLETILTEEDLYPFTDEIKEFLWMESKDTLSPVSKRPKLF